MSGAEIYQIVERAFTALGVADPQAIRRAILLRDCRITGYRFQCDGLQAICVLGQPSIAFYDRQQQLLQTIPLDCQV